MRGSSFSFICAASFLKSSSVYSTRFGSGFSYTYRPGLILTLSTCLATSSAILMPLWCTSATKGTSWYSALSFSLIKPTAWACARDGTVSLTISQPSSCSFLIAAYAPSMSIVSSFIIDWMTTGFPPPIRMSPTCTARVFLRGTEPVRSRFIIPVWSFIASLGKGAMEAPLLLPFPASIQTPFLLLKLFFSPLVPEIPWTPPKLTNALTIFSQFA
mmetsp:Transcript_20241/g.81439  ORF Transcript_20241/g.81439 Transcript_20241/m.81439 type:complete len:215 (-) Transcript_20241:205-849(-)